MTIDPRRGLIGAAVLAAAVCAQAEQAKLHGPHADLPDPAFHFNTFFVTRHGLTNPKFFEYLKASRPNIVQVGYYGPMLHGYGDNPKCTGYPMNLPVSGVNKLLEVYRRVNGQAHSLGLKVVGHFQTGKVIGKWEKREDFIDFYANRWDEKLLGPRPHRDVREVLQRDPDGTPIERGRTATVNYVGLCLSSPHTRQMLKQMLKLAIDTGVDGIMCNFNYRWSCVCPHCQKLFKAHLAERFSPAQLKQKFGIADLAAHTFRRIDAEIPGYPDPKTATPLDWEARRWGAIQFKQAFDEIFIDYGRKLKPDLILATWNHIGDLGVKEERAFLPIELWGRGESYFWYSGAHGSGDLANRQAGDGWLLAYYIRELCGRKPFLLGKYERIRMRVSMAEGVATGGGGMGRYMRYLDPAGCEALARYTSWMNENRTLYWPVEPYAEVALLLPRQAVLSGSPEAYDSFRSVGQALAERQVLLDVVADEKLNPDRLRPCPLVVVPWDKALSPEQRKMLSQYDPDSGVVLTVGKGEETQAVLKRFEVLAGGRISRIKAPWTIRAGAFRHLRDDRLLLHLVNYNRDGAGGRRRNQGPADERPIAEKNIEIDLRLPLGTRAASVLLRSPDAPNPAPLTFRQAAGRLQLTVPEVLVYAVLDIELQRPAVSR